MKKIIIHVLVICMVFGITSTATELSGDSALDGENVVESSAFEVGLMAASNPDPISIIAADGTSGQIAISWRNPSSVTVQALAVADSKGNILSSNFNLAAGAANAYTVMNLEDGRKYLFYLICTVNGVEKSYPITAIPKVYDRTSTTRDGYHLSNWKLSNSRFCDTTIDTADVYSGLSSLKIVRNNDNKDDFDDLTYNITLDTSKTYKLRMMAKVDNAKNFGLCKYTLGQQTGKILWGVGWTENTLDISNTGNVDIRFIIQTSAVVRLDKISLKEIKDGVEIGDNLIKNGDFEFEVNNLKLENNTLSWGIPQNAEWDSISLYQRDWNGNDTEISTGLAKDTTSYGITQAGASDSSYYYVVKTIADGAESNGASVKVTGNVDIYDVRLVDTSGNETGLKSGELTVSLPVKNNFIAEDYPVELLAALYNGNVMVALSKQHCIIPKTDVDAAANIISANITVPQNITEDYSLQIFIWDSIKNMNIREKFNTFE